MSPSEAAPIFAGAGSHCPQLHASDDTQSYCSYPGSTEGTSVLANGTMETNRSSKGRPVCTDSPWTSYPGTATDAAGSGYTRSLSALRTVMKLS